MSVPDVSVVVAVYNTMPYLTTCLDSLVAQTIGTDRIEVVAVDDGSTDGSGDELERFAADHPGVFRVVHQQNSGGPAGPNNRALALARGRFVFFLGADDHLGPEALERLVTCADEQDADVVFGRMVGTNDRYVHQKIFASTDLDLDLYDSELPFAIANTKLFRRSLVEERGLRYPEELRIGSDQPFTIGALVHSRRTCVLADYTYYYAVRREDASNISYHTTWRDRLWCTGRIMDEVATQLPPGDQRDAVLRRHLTWELAKLLRDDLLDLPADERQELVDGIGRLCDTYFTEALKRRMGVKRRIRLCLAQARRHDLLEETVRYERAFGDPPFVAERDLAYAAYPGWDGQAGTPRWWYELLDETVGGRLWESTHTATARLDHHGLVLGGTLPVVPPPIVLGLYLRPVKKLSSPGPRKARTWEELPAAEPVVTEASRLIDPERLAMTALSAAVPSPRLVGTETRVALRWRVQVAGWCYDLPVPRPPGGVPTEPVVVRSRGRRARARLGEVDGRLFLDVAPLRWRTVLTMPLRRLSGRRRAVTDPR